MKQNSIAHPNVDQWKSIELSTLGGLNVMENGCAKSRLLHRYPNITLSSSPIMPATSVITRFSAMMSAMMRPRVHPNERRTPISAVRCFRRLWVMELRLMAGTMRRIR